MQRYLCSKIARSATLNFSQSRTDGIDMATPSVELIGERCRDFHFFDGHFDRIQPASNRMIKVSAETIAAA
jgi:hypothetical protein